MIGFTNRIKAISEKQQVFLNNSDIATHNRVATMQNKIHTFIGNSIATFD